MIIYTIYICDIYYSANKIDIFGNVPNTLHKLVL